MYLGNPDTTVYALFSVNEGATKRCGDGEEYRKRQRVYLSRFNALQSHSFRVITEEALISALSGCCTCLYRTKPWDRGPDGSSPIPIIANIANLIGRP